MKLQKHVRKTSKHYPLETLAVEDFIRVGQYKDAVSIYVQGGYSLGLSLVEAEKLIEELQFALKRNAELKAKLAA